MSGHLRGRFVASSPSRCSECDSRIRTGASVYYDGHDDDRRLCAGCVNFDLFGDVA